MAEGEKFNFIKSVKSFFKVLDWYKAAMIALKVIGIGLIVLTIYKAWFEPKGGNLANQKQKTIFLGNIGSVSMDQANSQTQKADKSWLLALSCDTKANDFKNKEEIRVGIIVGKLF